jgi:hypothetical protein
MAIKCFRPKAETALSFLERKAASSPRSEQRKQILNFGQSFAPLRLRIEQFDAIPRGWTWLFAMSWKSAKEERKA